MLRREGLDQNPAPLLPPPRSPRRLEKEPERLFRRAEIGKTETPVRREHADEGDVRIMMALRDHLRAEKHVLLAARESFEHGEVARAPRGRIEVHPGDPHPGEQIHELHLHALRAGPAMHDLVLPAAGAGVGNDAPMSAVMAEEPLAAAVEREGDGAVGAPLDPAAGAALDEVRVPAPVEENDRLLAARDAFLERPDEAPRRISRSARAYRRYRRAASRARAASTAGRDSRSRRGGRRRTPRATGSPSREEARRPRAAP